MQLIDEDKGGVEITFPLPYERYIPYYLKVNLEQAKEKEFKTAFSSIMQFRQMYRKVERMEKPVSTLSSYIAMSYSLSYLDFAITMNGHLDDPNNDVKTILSLNYAKICDYYIHRVLRTNPELTRLAIRGINEYTQISFDPSYFANGWDDIKAIMKKIERRVF